MVVLATIAEVPTVVSVCMLDISEPTVNRRALDVFVSEYQSYVDPVM
jgi:hypothetical protein